MRAQQFELPRRTRKRDAFQAAPRRPDRDRPLVQVPGQAARVKRLRRPSTETMPHTPLTAVRVTDLRDRPDRRLRRQPKRLQLTIDKPLHPKTAKHPAVKRTLRRQVRRRVAPHERLRERLRLLPPRNQLHLPTSFTHQNIRSSPDRTPGPPPPPRKPPPSSPPSTARLLAADRVKMWGDPAKRAAPNRVRLRFTRDGTCRRVTLRESSGYF